MQERHKLTAQSKELDPLWLSQVRESYPPISKSAGIEKLADMVFNEAERYRSGSSDYIFAWGQPPLGGKCKVFPYDAAVQILETVFEVIPELAAEPEPEVLANGIKRCENEDPNAQVLGFPSDTDIAIAEYTTSLNYVIATRIDDEARRWDRDNEIWRFYEWLGERRVDYGAIDDGGDGTVQPDNYTSRGLNLGGSLPKVFKSFGRQNFKNGEIKQAKRGPTGISLILQLTCYLVHLDADQDVNQGSGAFLQWIEDCVDMTRTTKPDANEQTRLHPHNKRSEQIKTDHCRELYARVKSFTSKRYADNFLLFKSARTERYGKDFSPLKFREPLALALDIMALPDSERPISRELALETLADRGFVLKEVASYTSVLSDFELNLQIYTRYFCQETGRFAPQSSTSYVYRAFGAKAINAKTGEFYNAANKARLARLNEYPNAILFSYEGLGQSSAMKGFVENDEASCLGLRNVSNNDEVCLFRDELVMVPADSLYIQESNVCNRLTPEGKTITVHDYVYESDEFKASMYPFIKDSNSPNCATLPSSGNFTDPVALKIGGSVLYKTVLPGSSDVDLYTSATEGNYQERIAECSDSSRTCFLVRCNSEREIEVSRWGDNNDATLYLLQSRNFPGMRGYERDPDAYVAWGIRPEASQPSVAHKQGAADFLSDISEVGDDWVATGSDDFAIIAYKEASTRTFPTFSQVFVFRSQARLLREYDELRDETGEADIRVQRKVKGKIAREAEIIDLLKSMTDDKYAKMIQLNPDAWGAVLLVDWYKYAAENQQ